MLDKLVDFIISIIDKFFFIAIVDQYERGVLLRLGRYKRDLEPGPHFRIPFGVDSILTTPVVYDTMIFADQPLTLCDGTTISYSIGIAFTVEDPKVFLLEVDGAESALSDSVVMEAPRALAHRTFQDLLDSEVLEEASKELMKIVRPQARNYGIKLRKLMITNLVKARVLMLLGQ